MRFEDRGDEVRIIQPVAERAGERLTLLFASGLTGAHGTGLLYFVHLNNALGVLIAGVTFSLLSAGAFWKFESQRDEVCTVAFDYAKREAKLPNGAAVKFDKVRAVRRVTVEERYHSLSVVVLQSHGLYEISLCRMNGRESDAAVFEAAAAAIARALGVRHESRTYASPAPEKFHRKP